MSKDNYDYASELPITKSLLRIAEKDRDFWRDEYRRLLTQYNQKWGDSIKAASVDPDHPFRECIELANNIELKPDVAEEWEPWHTYKEHQ